MYLSQVSVTYMHTVTVTSTVFTPITPRLQYLPISNNSPSDQGVETITPCLQYLPISDISIGSNWNLKCYLALKGKASTWNELLFSFLFICFYVKTVQSVCVLSVMAETSGKRRLEHRSNQINVEALDYLKTHSVTKAAKRFKVCGQTISTDGSELSTALAFLYIL